MILPLLLAAATLSAKPGELKTFKDWTVGCDNGRACHATSLMPEGGNWEELPSMSIERRAEAAAQPVITLLGPNAKASRLRTAKGQPIRLITAGASADFTVDPRDSAAAMAALRADGTWSVEDGGGKRIGDISLAGLGAAMLYIDDMQKRVGTVTALAKPGAKPASAVPAPPPLPMVGTKARKSALAYRVTEAQIAALRKRHMCEPDGKDAVGYEAEQDSMGPNHVLLLLGCGAGAYNLSSVAFIATWKGDHFDVAPATYDFPPNSGEGQPMLVNASWDPDEGLLTAFSKGRGLGDCGVGSVYIWDGQGLRLAQQIEMRECRGSMDYITTWRARIVPN